MILQFWLALWPSEAQVHGSKYFVLYTDWKSHIEYIYHKLIRLVGIFYKLRNTGPTNLHKLLPAGCHGNLTVLNILSASVTKKISIFALQEKLCVGSKNDWHDVLYQRARFGGDRTTRAGRSENWCFLYVTLGLPAHWGHSSNKYCVTVYGSILMPFSAIFSEGIALSGALHVSHLRRKVERQFSRNCRQNYEKSKKSAEKFVRTTSYR